MDKVSDYNIGEVKDRRQFFIKSALFIILIDVLAALMLHGSYDVPIPMSVPVNMFSIAGITYILQLFGGIVVFTIQLLTFTLAFEGMPVFIQALLSITNMVIWLGLIWTMWDPIITVIEAMRDIAKSVLDILIPWYNG